jgi:ATP-binding cassette subfamily B protein
MILEERAITATKPPPDATRMRVSDLARIAGFGTRIAWRADRARLVGVLMTQFGSATGFGILVTMTPGLLGKGFSVNGTGEISQLLVPLAVVLAISSVNGILRIVSRAQQQVLAIKVDRHIVSLVLEAACRVDLRRFEDPAFYDRMQRAVFASRMQPMVFVTAAFGIFQASLSVCAVAVSFASIAWWLLPLVALAMVPMAKTARDERAAAYGLHHALTENRRMRQYFERVLTGRDEAKEVRAFGLEQALRARWFGGYADEIDQTVALHRRHNRRQILGRLTGDVVTALLVGSVLWLTHLHLLALSSALTVLLALWLLSTRMQMASYLLTNTGGSVMYLNDLQTFAAITDAEPPPAPHRPVTLFSRLQAERIDFTYPGAARPALRDVSITVNAGEIVALVGVNGSGKTTLAKILGGLYEPDNGRLLRGGEPVPAEALRDGTAVVFQDFIRYKLSVTDNIAFGGPDRPITGDGVAEAARRAGADRFVAALPHGYETVLSKEFTDGTDLSLGQWQRLALARAFYRDAPFVILDEPTASLDPAAEAELFTRIRELFADRTVIIISHRFSNVRAADRIYVLEDGRVIENGTHDQLMAADRTYANLFQTQASAYLDIESTGKEQRAPA